MGTAETLERARVDGAEFNRQVLVADAGGRIESTPAMERWHYLIDQHPKLHLWNHMESGDTTALAVGRTLFELGRNPNLRIGILCNDRGCADKVLNTILEYTYKSTAMHEVFPILRSLTYGRENVAIVADRKATLRDPSICTFGALGSVVTARLNLVIIADPLDVESEDAKYRHELSRWYRMYIPGRLMNDSRIISFGRVYHPEDLHHELTAQPGWYYERLPVRGPGGRLTWPSHWPAERVELFVNELGKLNSRRLLFCITPTAEEVERDAQRVGQVTAADGGETRACEATPDDELTTPTVPKNATVTIFVEPVTARGLPTRIRVLLTAPNGGRHTLWANEGVYSASEIRAMVLNVHQQYGAPVVVEDNAAQSWLADILGEKVDIQVYTAATTQERASPQDAEPAPSLHGGADAVL
jgi:hypothetical protein